MLHCRGRGFSLLVCVFFLSVAAGAYSIWEDTGRIDEVITDTNTGHVYTAGEKGIRHWSENLTFIAGVGWGDAEVGWDDCVGDAGGTVTAMALQPGSPRLLACSTACRGLCAVYNTSNITQRLWMNKGTNHSYINTRSVLVFLDNVRLLVASSTSDQPTPDAPVLSYRHLSLPDQGQPSMNISDHTESVMSRKPESNYSIHFISGFTKNNFTYFLTTQRETSTMNVTTRLIRFCTSYESLFPLMDFPLDCRTNDLTLYNIGLDMADTGSSITVSFGRNTDQSDFQEDPSRGSALCQYTFEDIRNGSSEVCKLRTTPNVSWADVTGGCNVQYQECIVCQPSQCQGTFLITDNSYLFNYKDFKTDFNAVYRNITIVITKVLPSEAGTVNVATSAGEVLQLTTGVDGNLSLSSNISVSGDRSLLRRVVVRDSNDTLHLFTISSNTVKEVDICEGRRCQECRRISRCSWCKKCVFSEACGGSTCKVQNWYPKKGPQSGGTVITFEGCGLNETDNEVKVAGRKCKLKDASLTRRRCKLRKKGLNDKKAGVTPDVSVMFPGCSLGNFTITPDPVITDVSPKTSIQSGGLTITVFGENFDAVEQPRIEVTVRNRTRGANCTRTNKITGDKVFCLTPSFTLESRNETPGNLSVIMDGVVAHYNITVYPDPTLVFTPTPLEVGEGDMLHILATLDGVNETDVRVEIGPSNCSNVHFNGTLITCTPVWMTYTKTPQNITVKVGNNLSLYAGQIMFVTRRSLSYNNIIIGSVVTVAVIAIIVVAVAAVCIKQYKSALHHPLQSELASTTEHGLNAYFLLEPRVQKPLSKELLQRIEQSKVIVPASRLKLGATIGSGNFGCVFAGMLYPESGEEEGAEKVAIKTMLDNSQNMDLGSFVEEALVMKGFDHENVLQLLGISVSESQQPMVVLPFMANGDLLSFVSDDAKEVRVYDILRWGVDIAEGMNYLSTLRLVHRDLAARNCMLDDNLRVKVADFGLCRDIYEKGYYTSDNKKKLPIRWMAPESMERGSYSSKSDVWSLGVVVWELLTRGATPYPGVDGWDIARFLQHGRRLQQPWFCSNELYGVMLEIWSQDPGLRPTFSEVSESLTTLLKLSSDQEVTSESKDDGYVTFPSCYRYVELRVPEYFVIETEASKENLDAMPV